MSSTCGDFGGRTASGEPCQRPRKSSRCPDHSEEAAEELRALKEELLDLLREEPAKSLEQLCQEVGISTATLYRWRDRDDSFAESFRQAQLEQDRRRLELMEQSLFERILEKPGTVSAALEIFAFVNTARRVARASGELPRWEHKQQLEIEAEVWSEGELSIGALRRARERLEQMEEESLESPWEGSSEKEPGEESIPSPWEEREEPPPELGNGDSLSSV